MHCCWHGFFRTNFINTIVPKNCTPKSCQSFRTRGHGTCIASLAGSETKRAELLARIFQDKFHQRDCPKKLVPKTCQTVSKRWAKGHAGHAWEKVLCWRSFHFARRSVRRCLIFAPFAARNFYTEQLVHTEALTQKSLYTEKFLHTGAFAQENLCTGKLLHTETFTHRSFVHREVLHRGAFTHRRVYTEKSLHRGAFAHRILYTQTRSHTGGFTNRQLYGAQNFT